jgi:hypothetical protein
LSIFILVGDSYSKECSNESESCMTARYYEAYFTTNWKLGDIMEVKENVRYIYHLNFEHLFTVFSPSKPDIIKATSCRISPQFWSSTPIIQDSELITKENCPIVFEHFMILETVRKDTIEMNGKGKDKVVDEKDERMKWEENVKIIWKSPSNQGCHLYVFVHGLAGNSYDLRYLKNYMAYVFRCESASCQFENSV